MPMLTWNCIGDCLYERTWQLGSGLLEVIEEVEKHLTESSKISNLFHNPFQIRDCYVEDTQPSNVGHGTLDTLYSSASSK
jgi:hypothetical protein